MHVRRLLCDTISCKPSVVETSVAKIVTSTTYASTKTDSVGVIAQNASACMALVARCACARGCSRYARYDTGTYVSVSCRDSSRTSRTLVVSVVVDAIFGLVGKGRVWEWHVVVTHRAPKHHNRNRDQCEGWRGERARVISYMFGAP